MIGFLARRAASLAATLAAVSVVVFLVLNVLPGDPAALMLGTGAREDTLAALRHRMGLDAPAPLRYARWAGGVITGDLGESYTYGAPVADLVAQRAEVSVPLGLIAAALAMALAIPLGVAAAARPGGVLDAALIGGAQAGAAVPNFWLGILLILLFAVSLGWLPAGGFPGWGAGPWPALRALILPAVALALPQAAVLARVTRAAVLDVMGADFLRSARAKGLGRRAALWRHAVPNALVLIATVVGLQVSFLISGTVIIESTFALPGLGRLLFQAILQRDLPVVQSVTVLVAATVVLVNFAVDVAAALIDPRRRTAAA